MNVKGHTVLDPQTSRLVVLPSKPSWLRIARRNDGRRAEVAAQLGQRALHTVCEEAHCPNQAECWEAGTATVMLMGDVCTRGCRFCQVKTSASPPALDPLEPRQIAGAVTALGLEYVVVTSVDRDDLPDGGAAHFAEAIRELKAISGLRVEALTPDFQGDRVALGTIGRAAPDVFGNNLETVRRLTPVVRDRRAGYQQTLDVLAAVKRDFPGIVTKSSIMVGLGEERDEVEEAMRDLRVAGVEILTIGQYLRPTRWHLPVQEYLSPDSFEAYRQLAQAIGFRFVASGPLVRSSYRAGEFFRQYGAGPTGHDSPGREGGP